MRGRSHRRHFTFALTLTVLTGLGLSAGCAATAQGSDAPHIVVTTNILGDVVSQVLQDQATVTVLMRPNTDPHSFEISAQEAVMLSDADLIVSSGLGLEEGLQKHLNSAASGTDHLVAGDAVDVLPYASGETAGMPDPHFWTDPNTIVDVVDALERHAVALPGIDEVALHASADAYRAQLASLDTDMRLAFAQIPDEHRALVTNHHVFGYLAHRYGFRIIGAVIPGGTTLAAPSAADLHDLSNAITASGIPAIFAESSQPDRLVQVLASEADLEVRVVELFTESLSAPGAGAGAETYLQMMRANTERITSGLT